MEHFLLGITGKKRTGKDTIYSILKKQWSPRVHHEYFANPIEVIAKEIFGVDENGLKNKDSIIVKNLLTANDLTVRTLFQKIGDGFRNIYPTIFSDLMDFRIKQLKEPKIIVITDVRFQNEADYIFGKGGFVVEIKRKTDLKDGHISEDRTVTSNASIENNLGLAELYQEIKRVIFPIIPKVHFIKKHPGYLSVPESQLVEFYSTGRQFQEIPDLMDIKEYIVDIEIKDNLPVKTI